MSQTITTLTTEALSAALERAEEAYLKYVDDLNLRVLRWGFPDADPEAFLSDDPTPLIRQIQAAAAAKWTLARLILTKPVQLPPSNLASPAGFFNSVVAIGDAVDLEDLSLAVADLRQEILYSSWDMETTPAGVVEPTPEASELGGLNDLGEVTDGPSEVP